MSAASRRPRGARRWEHLLDLKRPLKEDQVLENIWPVRAISPALARSSITAVMLAMHRRLRGKLHLVKTYHTGV